MAQEQQREELLIRDRVTGQPRPYYVDAGNINLGDDETYKSLPDVLDEMQDDIDDAKEHGGGSVTCVKVGDTTYSPDQQGVVDISPAIPDVSGKANKSEMSIVPGTGANADKTTITLKEGTSATVLTQHQDISNKANSSEVVKGIKDSNGNPLPKNQDGTITLPAVQAGDKVSVIQPDPADGTFTIRVGSDDFTVNLNHTHPNMAKLIVCEESDLPSTLDPATIYAITDSGETEIEKLIIRGMEFARGGAAPGTPDIARPSGTSINLGENSGSGVSKTIEIKANSHITGDLTVGLAANSDLSFDTTNLPSGVTYNSGAGTLTIAQASAMQGVNITIDYSGSGAAEIEGGIVISGGGLLSPKSIKVVVERGWVNVDLDAANREIVNGWPGSAGTWNTTAGQYSILIPTTDYTQIEITANDVNMAYFLFCKTRPASSPGSVYYASLLCDGETGRRTQTKDTTEVYSLPSDCVCVVIGLSSSGSNESSKPTSVRLK